MGEMGDYYRDLRKAKQKFRSELPFCPDCKVTKLTPHLHNTEWWCKYCKDTHPMSGTEKEKYRENPF